MDEPQEVLREEGVPQDDIDRILDAIATATRAVFDEYGVALDAPRPVIEAVQTTVLRQTVELGRALDHNSPVAQFDVLREDFENSDSAHSNILYALGAVEESDRETPTCVREIGGAILARNYGDTAE